ncbi:MAG: hypothetical protein JO185_17490 [Acidobacteriaceae bacterium]|nr:hypothetical protein [Acidobacteriaceae bacterium]
MWPAVMKEQQGGEIKLQAQVTASPQNAAARVVLWTGATLLITILVGLIW